MLAAIEMFWMDASIYLRALYHDAFLRPKPDFCQKVNLNLIQNSVNKFVKYTEILYIVGFFPFSYAALRFTDQISWHSLFFGVVIEISLFCTVIPIHCVGFLFARKKKRGKTLLLGWNLLWNFAIYFLFWK